ncbi:MAG: hypothetical protein L3J51_02755 [Cocleimonas sp.]|nr:hypothetical protein [Cocleimonas sp.]
MKTKIAHFFILLISLVIITTGVGGCSQPDSPKGVSEQFWEAVQKRDMESAKGLSTWDTVDYLKYLKTQKLHPERYELGEVMLGETRAEVATVLYTQKQGKSGFKVPGVTILVKTDKGWLVDVKKTLNSVVKHTIDNVFDQLNGFMQEGIKELDKSLSESMGEVGRALEEGTQELKKEFSSPLFRDGIDMLKEEIKQEFKQQFKPHQPPVDGQLNSGHSGKAI